MLTSLIKVYTMFNNIDVDLRAGCKMRHENGNCLPCGGYCLAVSDGICVALHNAFNCGYFDCFEALQKDRSK